MKPIRKDYPPIRAYVNHGKTYYRVDLRRKNHVGASTRQFTDVTAAKDFARGIAEQVNSKGVDSIATVGTDPRIAVWSQQLSIYGVTVEGAIAIALNHLAADKTKKETPFAGELLNLWLDDKISNPLKPLRAASIKGIRAMANNFKTDFGTKRIAEIDKHFVDAYVKSKDVSNRTRHNIVNYLSQFFNWCIHKDYTTQKNPCVKMEIHVAQGVPEFFTVEQCQEIMKTALKDKSIMPYLSLCLFAGIRPKETERMTWENINMETNEITIQATIAKTKKSRLFAMESNLIEWLKTADKDQPLIPVNLRKVLDKALEDLTFDWKNDGLRHSLATYHYAKHKNMEMLRHVMGNSPSVIDKFYKGVISNVEVEKFWNITPASLKN